MTRATSVPTSGPKFIAMPFSTVDLVDCLLSFEDVRQLGLALISRWECHELQVRVHPKEHHCE